LIYFYKRLNLEIKIQLSCEADSHEKRDINN
jgi:hypothetical protein